MSPTNTIEVRISKITCRIRSTACSRTVAALVDAMTARRDVEAIPALISLLDLRDADVASVERALIRYGEAAEDAIKAHLRGSNGAARVQAVRLLSRIAYRARLRQLGCF